MQDGGTAQDNVIEVVLYCYKEGKVYSRWMTVEGFLFLTSSSECRFFIRILANVFSMVYSHLSM